MRLEKKYRGVVVPMITPFHEDLTIDDDAVGRIIKLLLESGASPFVLGTTGESASISTNEKEKLVKAVVGQAKGNTLVYAGISSNCLSESVEFAEKYAGLGVDVLVSTLPAYYPLNEDQMFRYFEQLADQVSLPLMIYNMPATTKLSIPLDVIDKLSYHPNIVGVKDSERGEERLDQSIRLWKNRPDFVHFLGWAAKSAYALNAGSDGIVPSTGNFAPELYVSLYNSIINGDVDAAFQFQTKTDELSLLYQEDRILSQSIPALKAIMSVKGLCSPNVLPPMYRMKTEEEIICMERIKKKLNEMKIDF